MDTIFDLEKDDISAMDISLGDAISLRKLKKNKDNLLDVVEKTVPKDNYESQTALNDQLTPTPTPLNRTSPVLFQDDLPHEQESTTPSSSQITSPPYSLMTPSPIKKRKTITYDHPEIEVSTTSSSSQIDKGKELIVEDFNQIFPNRQNNIYTKWSSLVPLLKTLLRKKKVHISEKNESNVTSEMIASFNFL